MAVAKGVLYVVATPIGNLGDMTARAREVLSQVDVIACEDTRHSAKLLHHFGIHTPCLAYHEHNERQLSGQLVERLAAGQSIALIADAGTPLISDPGYHLVRQARQAGLQVVAVPGASAVLAALSISGLPCDRFVFEGFLPARSGPRLQRLEALASDTRTLIFYESPHRIEHSLEDMRTVFGDEREVVVARELTKRYETVRAGSLLELTRWLASDEGQRRGEFVVLVHGVSRHDRAEMDDQSMLILRLLLKELPLKRAVALAAEITGRKKNALYRTALTLNGSDRK